MSRKSPNPPWCLAGGRRVTLGGVAGRCARLTLVLVAALLLVPAPDAAASCAPPGDTRDRLAAADAAFTGEYVRQKAPPGSAGENVLVYRVREAVKGPLGDQVEVVDEGASTSVGLTRGVVGREIGLFLRRSGGEYVANACMSVDPDGLREAAGDSGIRGKVTLVDDGCGPSDASGPPATVTPVDARLVFRNRARRVVRVARSGRDGRFQVRLRPGKYAIEAGRVTGKDAESSGDQQPVRVRAGRFSRVVISYRNTCP